MKFHTLEKQQRRKEVQRHQKKRKRKIALIMVDTVLSNCEPVLRKGQMDQASRLSARLPKLCYILNSVPVLHETLLFTYQGVFLLFSVNLLITKGNLETMFNFICILYSWKTETLKKLSSTLLCSRKQLTAKKKTCPITGKTHG